MEVCPNGCDLEFYEGIHAEDCPLWKGDYSKKDDARPISHRVEDEDRVIADAIEREFGDDTLGNPYGETN